MTDMLIIILRILGILAVALLGIVLIACCLLMTKTGIEYKINIKNFSFSFDYKLILCNKKIIPKKKKTKKSREESEPDKTRKEEKKKKISLSDVYEIKPAVFDVLDALLEICEKHIVFERFNTKIVSALDNPAANGILYGGLQTVMNIIYAHFLAVCNVKESELKIYYDFKSSEGLIAENCGKIYIRPFFVAASALKIYIFKKDIRKNIKKLINFFSK